MIARQITIFLSSFLAGVSVMLNGGNPFSAMTVTASAIAGLYGIHFSIQKAEEEITKRISPHSPLVPSPSSNKTNPAPSG